MDLILTLSPITIKTAMTTTPHLAGAPLSARTRHGRRSHGSHRASHGSTRRSLLLQHGPVEGVVILVVQGSEQDPEDQNGQEDREWRLTELGDVTDLNNCLRYM